MVQVVSKLAMTRIHRVFVVDRANRLEGVISLKVIYYIPRTKIPNVFIELELISNINVVRFFFFLAKFPLFFNVYKINSG